MIALGSVLDSLRPDGLAVATLVIALIFRRDVGQVLGRIGQVRYRDLELTFRDDLRQAEPLARSIPPPAATKAPVLLEVAPDEAKPLGGRLIVTPSAGEGQPSAAELTGGSPREAVEVPGNVVRRRPRPPRPRATGGSGLDQQRTGDPIPRRPRPPGSGRGDARRALADAPRPGGEPRRRATLGRRRPTVRPDLALRLASGSRVA